MNSNYMWELIFIIPNLRLENSFEDEYIAIVPYDDERLQNLISQDETVATILTNFKTESEERVDPSALILRSDTPKTIKTSEAIVAFRNTLAISCLLHSNSLILARRNVFEPTYSDHFDFYPITLAKGGGLIISSPATMAIWPKPDKFCGQTYPHIPNFDLLKAKPDKFLAEKLVKLWKKRFVSPAKDSWNTRLLFRSLEVAYQALITPVRNNSSIYEYGTNLALWVCPQRH